MPERARRPGARGLLSVLAATLVAAAAFGGSSAAQTSAAQTSPARDYGIVSHRGYPGTKYTENTLPAFSRALYNGATAIETDVRMTRDKAFLLMHDPTLGRTTRCAGRIAARSATDIRTNCAGRRGSERIPALGEVLTWASTNRMNVVLEIKPDPRWAVEDLTRIDAMLREHGMKNRTVLLSKRSDLLQMAEVANPGLRTQLIIDWWYQVAKARTWADGLNIYAGQLTAGRVASLHADAVQVIGRNTSRRLDWAKLDRVAADGLVTDDLQGYEQWSGKQR